MVGINRYNSISLVLTLCVGCALATFDPEFVLPNFPHARQETEWYCGPASLQMVYTYILDQVVPQTMFASVGRTSEAVGTLSFDIVRALRFSKMSEPSSYELLSSRPIYGYGSAGVGLSADGFWSPTPWIDDLKQTLRQGTPVIVLQQFWFDDPGGHYRVVYGFNNTHIYVKDPWVRDGWTEDLALTNREFVHLWNYTEQPHLGPTYFGAAAKPWKSTLILKPRTGMLYANFYYSYSLPFGANVPAATMSSLDRVLITSHYDPDIWNVSISSIVKTQTLFPGDSGETGEILVNCLRPNGDCPSNSLTFSAAGIVVGSVPRAVRDETSWFPAYQYMDVIGTAETI